MKKRPLFLLLILCLLVLADSGIPAIAIALFVHLLVSLYLEYGYIQRKLSSPKPLLRKAALLANVASYGFLAAGIIVLGLGRR